ncbi:MAG: phosphate propanoyltransferase [Syntrophomonadaceae bacterium]|nr:phosphate propanoyltransferase [Syntrophomonadaceae bacterium]
MADSQEEIIYQVIKQYMEASGQSAARPEPLPPTGAASVPEPIKLKVGVSNRHIHLDRQDLDELFGQGYELNEHQPLSQAGMFAAQETVILAGPKGALTGVRVLGPLRSNTQVELAFTDARHLGVVPPVMQSGQTGKTPEITIVGPKGSVTNNNAVMVAWRHAHMDTDRAAAWGLKDGDIVTARTPGDRAVVFENVVVRTGKGWVNEFHIDTDEGNTANIKTGDTVEIIRG